MVSLDLKVNLQRTGTIEKDYSLEAGYTSSIYFRIYKSSFEVNPIA